MTIKLIWKDLSNKVKKTIEKPRTGDPNAKGTPIQDVKIGGGGH